MGLIVRLLFFVGGALASLVLTYDSANYEIVSMMFGILAFVLVVLLIVLFTRER